MDPAPPFALTKLHICQCCKNLNTSISQKKDPFSLMNGYSENVGSMTTGSIDSKMKAKKAKRSPPVHSVQGKSSYSCNDTWSTAMYTVFYC